MRTQQIIAHESGAALTVDPLAGSYYVEALTNELERQALQLLERVDSLGGAAKAIGASFFQEEIGRSAYAHQLRVESGETVIVGVNKFADGESETVVAPPDYSALERDQVARLREVRSHRDARAVQAALSALGDAAATYVADSGRARAELMPRIVDAVRARASVGEISDVLRERWGVHRPV